MNLSYLRETVILPSYLKDQCRAANSEAYYTAGSCCPAVCLSSHLVSRLGYNTLDIHFRCSHLHNYLKSQGIFPTQSLNPSLLHCRQILYHLSHEGSPRTLEWVAYTLLQEIFSTQESNWGLLHCMPILYQLIYQGSPQGLGPRFNHIPTLLSGPSRGRKHWSRVGSQLLQHSVIWGIFR